MLLSTSRTQLKELPVEGKIFVMQFSMKGLLLSANQGEFLFDIVGIIQYLTRDKFTN